MAWERQNKTQSSMCCTPVSVPILNRNHWSCSLWLCLWQNNIIDPILPTYNLAEYIIDLVLYNFVLGNILGPAAHKTWVVKSMKQTRWQTKQWHWTNRIDKQTNWTNNGQNEQVNEQIEPGNWKGGIIGWCKNWGAGEGSQSKPMRDKRDLHMQLTEKKNLLLQIVNCYKNIRCWHGLYSFPSLSSLSTSTLRTTHAYTCIIFFGWSYFPLTFSGYILSDRFPTHLYYICLLEPWPTS
jgi:hypothetical protein